MRQHASGELPAQWRQQARRIDRAIGLVGHAQIACIAVAVMHRPAPQRHMEVHAAARLVGKRLGHHRKDHAFAFGQRMVLFVLTGLTLLGFFLFARWLISSKFGRVLQAIRDAETRVMFSGYNPIGFKLTIWTISAIMCGVAGALYVPQVGIINPGEMSPANSIEIAIWAAVGGRATLVGPIVGAFVVNGAKSWLTVAYPEFWLYVLGALFIAVTLFLPQGIVGLVKKWKGSRHDA